MGLFTSCLFAVVLLFKHSFCQNFYIPKPNNQLSQGHLRYGYSNQGKVTEDRFNHLTWIPTSSNKEDYYNYMSFLKPQKESWKISTNSRQDEPDKKVKASEISITTEGPEQKDKPEPEKPGNEEPEKKPGNEEGEKEPTKEGDKEPSKEGDKEPSKEGDEEPPKEEKAKLTPFEELKEDISRPEFYLPLYNDLTVIALMWLLMPAIIPTIFIPLASYVVGSLFIPFVRFNHYVNAVLKPNVGG